MQQFAESFQVYCNYSFSVDYRSQLLEYETIPFLCRTCPQYILDCTRISSARVRKGKGNQKEQYQRFPIFQLRHSKFQYHNDAINSTWQSLSESPISCHQHRARFKRSVPMVFLQIATASLIPLETVSKNIAVLCQDSAVIQP